MRLINRGAVRLFVITCFGKQQKGAAGAWVPPSRLPSIGRSRPACSIIQFAYPVFYITYLVEAYENRGAKAGLRKAAREGEESYPLKEGGKILPMGWRSKFVFLLIVYFGGFATAVYCLAPAPEGQAGVDRQKGSLVAALRSDEFAKSVNSGVHKSLDLGKEAARRLAELIKQKVDEAQARSKK